MSLLRAADFKRVGSSNTAREARHQVNNTIRKQKKDETIRLKRDFNLNAPEVVCSISRERNKQAVAYIIHAKYELETGLEYAVKHGALVIRQLLCAKSGPVDEVIESGVVPILVKILSEHQDASVQLDIAWALTNILAGPTVNCEYCIQQGVVEPLLKLLKSDCAEVRDQALWGIGNVAGESPTYSRMLLQAEAHCDIVRIATDRYNCSNSARATCVWALTNLCRGGIEDRVVCDLIMRAFSHLIHIPNVPMAKDIIYGVCYMSSGSDDVKRIIAESGIMHVMLKLLPGRSNHYALPIINTLGNLAVGDDVYTKYVVSLGVMDVLHRYVLDTRSEVVKSTCWLVGNIAAEATVGARSVMQSPCLQYMISTLRLAREDSLKVEILHALNNLVINGGHGDIGVLITMGILPAVVELLTSHNVDILLVGLECLHGILSNGADIEPENPYPLEIETLDGIDALEELTIHQDNRISDAAGVIIDVFFNNE